MNMIKVTNIDIKEIAAKAKFKFNVNPNFRILKLKAFRAISKRTGIAGNYNYFHDRIIINRDVIRN
ncbi:unnamed protein product, partial [marine sediment metagenome]